MSGKFVGDQSSVKMVNGKISGDLHLAITAKVGDSEAFYAEFNDMAMVASLHSDSKGVWGEFSTLTIGSITPSTFRTQLPGVTATSMASQLELLVTGL